MAIWHKMQWDNIDRVVSNPAVVELFVKWQVLHRVLDRIPSVKDMGLDTWPQHSTRLMVLQAEGTDFRYTYYGADIRQHSQFDMTGKLVSDFGGEVGDFFLARYQEVVARKQPLYTVHYADRAKSVLTWERLILPLQCESGILLLVYNTSLETRLVLLEAVLNATNDAILALRPVFDEAGVCHDWLVLVANTLACKLIGSQHPQPSGFNVSQVFPQWFELGLESYCSDGIGSANGISFELEWPDVDGAKRQITGRAATLGDGCVIRLNDVTQQRLYENLLLDARRQAESAAMSKASFLATMSHEIRTPMNGIIGMTSMLLETALSQEQQEFTDVIRSSSESLLVVVNDILDYSKIESGNMKMEWAPFDLQEAIESSIDLMAVLAQNKKIDLLYFMESDVPRWLYGDFTRVRQVLVNLISNALKFTEQGEVLVQVKLVPLTQVSSTLGSDAAQADVLSAEPLGVEVSVTDTGIGIAQNKIKNLFQAFSQVDPSTSREYGGTGLGLVICKRLVEAMGGLIWVESDHGSGSRFVFSFRSESAPASLGIGSLDCGDLKGKRVLLLDDNQTNLRILTLQTQRWGMHSLACKSPEMALGYLASGEHFDLCITDMQMPLMDGSQFGEAARAHLPSLPIVLLSSVHIKPSPAFAHFSSVLIKPARQSALFDALMLATNGSAVLRLRDKKSAGFDAGMAMRHPLRVLLVEDNEVNTKVALRLLGGFGYRADVAADGIEALQAIDRQPYDVVLMDIQMPRMDGIEAMRQLAEKFKNDAIAVMPKVIGMSANAMRDDVDRALASGMADYITKPITVSALAQALENSYRIDSVVNRRTDTAPAFEEPAHAQEWATVLSAERIDPILELDPTGDFLAELAESFQTNVADLIGKMRLSVQYHQSQEISRIAHQIKGLSANLGVMGLSSVCAVIESKALSGALVGIELLMTQAAQSLNQGVAALDQRVAAVRALASTPNV